MSRDKSTDYERKYWTVHYQEVSHVDVSFVSFVRMFPRMTLTVFLAPEHSVTPERTGRSLIVKPTMRKKRVRRRNGQIIIEHG